MKPLIIEQDYNINNKKHQNRIRLQHKEYKPLIIEQAYNINNQNH